MTEIAEYFRISEGEPLPEIAAYSPFRAVLVIDTGYTAEWQLLVSRWLVESGCLYMLAWGEDCSSWDDNVDYTNADRFGDRDIPDEQFVMTTWHEHQSLDDVFWEAQFAAHHGDVELPATLIVHLGKQDRRGELLTRFAEARDQPCE